MIYGPNSMLNNLYPYGNSGYSARAYAGSGGWRYPYYWTPHFRAYSSSANPYFSYYAVPWSLARQVPHTY